MITIMHFESNIAKKYGVNCALVHRFISQGLKNLPSDDERIYNKDGIKYFKASVNDMRYLFDFLSSDQIRRAINKLLEANEVIYVYDDSFGMDRRRAFTTKYWSDMDNFIKEMA